MSDTAYRVVPAPVRAQMEGKPLDCVVHVCDHQRTPYGVGMCVIYECTRCGDEYEKDVS